MLKRMLLMLAIVAVLLAGLGFMKMQQVKSAVQASSFAPPPEAVTTVVAQPATWPSTFTAVGTLAAIHGVTVSADLPGTVEKITFDSGQFVKEGEVLLELDTRQERAQLAAMEAQRDLAGLNHGRAEQLARDGVISKMDYDRAAAEHKQLEAQVAEVRATIARKTIRAPFSGVLGIRQANRGQYLAPGAAIVPLQSLDPIYVNFGVPQQVLSQIRPGESVRLTTDQVSGAQFTGRINALDSVVDTATRNVQVQATVPNPGGKLRPGMFTNVELAVGASKQVFAIPASAISYAPFGDSVYVVAELKDPQGKSYKGVRQQFVKLEGSRGDQVGVVSGINRGDEVVTAGVFKLRNGAAVQVNNSVQPGNNPKPKPEDQ